MTIPYAQTSVCAVCLPTSRVSFAFGVRSSIAIHLAEPFIPVVVFAEDVDMQRDMPKSASSGTPESDINTLSCFKFQHTILDRG